jgi:hypothetical protein
MASFSRQSGRGTDQIDHHVVPAMRNSVEIVVAVLCHVDTARKSFCWGDSSIFVLSVLRWALRCECVKVVLLLGCSTAFPTRLLPPNNGKAILAVERPVSYDHLWLFYQQYLNHFRKYSREEPGWDVKKRSLNSMHAACNNEVTRNKYANILSFLFSLFFVNMSH